MTTQPSSVSGKALRELRELCSAYIEVTSSATDMLDQQITLVTMTTKHGRVARKMAEIFGTVYSELLAVPVPAAYKATIQEQALFRQASLEAAMISLNGGREWHTIKRAVSNGVYSEDGELFLFSEMDPEVVQFQQLRPTVLSFKRNKVDSAATAETNPPQQSDSPASAEINETDPPATLRSRISAFKYSLIEISQKYALGNSQEGDMVIITKDGGNVLLRGLAHIYKFFGVLPNMEPWDYELEATQKLVKTFQLPEEFALQLVRLTNMVRQFRNKHDDSSRIRVVDFTTLAAQMSSEISAMEITVAHHSITQ